MPENFATLRQVLGGFIAAPPRRMDGGEKMTPPLLVLRAIASGAAARGPWAAKNFPSRLIRIVVPFPAGGPTDILARHVGQRLSAGLGQSVIIEHEAGAGGRTRTPPRAPAAPDAPNPPPRRHNPNAHSPPPPQHPPPR